MSAGLSEWRESTDAFWQRIVSCWREVTLLLARLWKERLQLLDTWYAKTLVAIAFALVAVTALVNLWGIRSINHHVLPHATHTACTALEREVDLGQVRWVAPIGLIGASPIASIGPVTVGPSAMEGSAASIPEVLIKLDPLQSLVHRKLMVQLQADRAEVSLVQNSNFSWFGYPEDTEPSCRNFLPGLHKGQKASKDADSAPDPRPMLELQSMGHIDKVVEKEERRKLFPVPPEAAANFRPAVGRELVERAVAARRASRKASQGTATARKEAAQSEEGQTQHMRRDDGAGTQSQTGSQPGDRVSATVGAKASPRQYEDSVLPGEGQGDDESSRRGENALPADLERIQGNGGGNEADTAGEHVRSANQGSAPETRASKERPPEQVLEKASDPVVLSSETVLKQQGTQDLADSSAAAAAARLGMVEPTVDALRKLAGPDADIGMVGRDGHLDRGQEAGEADPLSTAPCRSVALAAARTEFATLSAMDMGLKDLLEGTEAATSMPSELSNIEGYEVQSDNGSTASLFAQKRCGTASARRHARGTVFVPAFLKESEDAEVDWTSSCCFEFGTSGGGAILFPSLHPARADTESHTNSVEESSSDALEADKSSEESLVQERIQLSADASTSGRDAEQEHRWFMQDRVRTHGGYKEGSFSRPSIRRTTRSYMRRHSPLSEQIKAMPSPCEPLRQANEADAVADPRIISSMEFWLPMASDDAPKLLVQSKSGTGSSSNCHWSVEGKRGQQIEGHNLPIHKETHSAQDTQRLSNLRASSNDLSREAAAKSPPQEQRSSAANTKRESGTGRATEVAENSGKLLDGTASGRGGGVTTRAHGGLTNKGQDGSEISRARGGQGRKEPSKSSRKHRRRSLRAEGSQLLLSARKLSPEKPQEETLISTKSSRQNVRPIVKPTPPVKPRTDKGTTPVWVVKGQERLSRWGALIRARRHEGSSATDTAQEQAYLERRAAAAAERKHSDGLPKPKMQIGWRPKSVSDKHQNPPRSRESASLEDAAALSAPESTGNAAAASSEGKDREISASRPDAGKSRWEQLRKARRLIKARRDAMQSARDTPQAGTTNFSLQHASVTVLGRTGSVPSLPASLQLPMQPAEKNAQTNGFRTAVGIKIPDGFSRSDEEPQRVRAQDARQGSRAPTLVEKEAQKVDADLENKKQKLDASSSTAIQPSKMTQERPVMAALSAPLPEGPKTAHGKLEVENAESHSIAAEAPASPSGNKAPAEGRQSAASKTDTTATPRVSRQSSTEPRLSKPKQRTHTSKRPRVAEEDTGPRYKPGTQSMLGSKRGVGGWLSRHASPLLRKIKLPVVGVESIRIRGGELKATMVGEPLPRQISDVDLTVRLSSDYRNMTLDVAGNAHNRNPGSNRCTMTTTEATRHLREVPSYAITHLPTDAPVSIHLDSQGALPKLQEDLRIGTGMGGLSDSIKSLKAEAQQRFADDRGNEKAAGEASGARSHWWDARKTFKFKRKPLGGTIRARVVSKGLHLRYPDTRVQLWGKNLHAPMAERVLELPIDVYDGRFDGDFTMHAYNEETWRLPNFGGRIGCKGLSFHFWDATDDFFNADMDLLFEGNRLYLHNASGLFGAVPMTITGDMDLDPLTGQYRLIASVPGVEVNELRKTLGIKPPPFPVGGALRGILHCTGPLEQPVFSGTAVALPPSKEAVEGMEDSNAKTTLKAEPKAAGAYDKVPFASASAIFTMDTSNDIFLLHSLQAEPLDGGELIGNGRMWVNAVAEHDPRAVKIHMEGRRLPFEPLLLRYMPKGMHIPAALVLGEGRVEGTMKGSHMAPDITAKWDLPSASASGTAQFSRETTKITCKAPAIDVSGALHVVAPDYEDVKRATTQAEVSALAVPVIDGLDLDADFKGLDVLPVLSPPEALEHIHSSQPLRLKVNGRVKFSGAMNRHAEKSTFAGDMSLDNLRVNQLKLSRNLAGILSVAEDSFQIQAKGSRPDEALDVVLKLPLLQPEPSEGLPAGKGAASSGANVGVQPFSIKLADLLPLPSFEPSVRKPLSNSPPHGGGHFSLRCGQLLMSAEMNGKASLVDCQVQGLKLDELELASLRGEVEEASLRLDLEARQGRGQVVVQGPRFSGLQGESLSTAVRWERDVVRLERANLQQKNSRYEVQGEYVIPASVAIPRSAASMALPPRDSESSHWSPFESSSGRWRIQVNVPTAQMEEILPAARLLSRATSPTPSDYERAKSAFLQGVREAAIQAQDLGRQLEAAAESARAQVASSLASDEARSGNRSGKSGGGPRAALPGLQDLKGQWNGTFQAYGGGGGAANVDFNMRGQDWTWGDYALDQAVAQGACHSLEGVKIEEVSLRAGEAKLLIRGKLLTADQNASILLTDFPVELLQPLFRSMPALQHAAPAAGSGASGGSSSSGLSGLTRPFTHRSGDRAELSARPSSTSSFSNSPVNGLLYLRGIIGGSASVPEGELVVRLFDGAIGPTQLAQAQATASLDAAQRLSFAMDIAPAEPRSGGFARVTGSLPLSPPTTTSLSGPAEAAADEAVEVSMNVKDGGMKLVRIMTPDFHWQSGNADIELKLHGQPGDLALDGGMHLSKATVTSPFLKYPMTNVAASVSLADNIVQVENVEAKVGRRGFVRVRGDLPIARQPGKHISSDAEHSKRRWNVIAVDVHDLELRLRSIYTGYLDASLQVRNSLVQPVLGGDIRLSKGTAMLVPQGSSVDPDRLIEAAKEDDLVQKAFTALTRKDAKQLTKAQDGAKGGEGMPAMQLQGLQVRLGPELRAMYPVVVNMGISGDLEINGPADPNQLRITGVINLESGEINLVAAQLVLDREHSNRLVFEGQEGLDPVVDLSLRGAQIRALIQGRASTWHRHLVLTPINAAAGEAAEQLQPSEAARIFEGQLASALVAEDGQLALSNLAVSAAHGFMPKIQTQGQLGQARWRLVSAPSIPGLLSLDPAGDPTSLLSSLTMGTEVEVQFGNSLQAAMARKLRDSDIATQWTLNYQLNSKLRMQFTIASVHPYPRTLLFQYSGDSS